MTPLPVPTVDRTDKRWKSNAFWRGDVWPPTNYQIASGLAAYDHHDLAAEIGDKTIANAIKNGISEHYDSISGRPLGVRDYCMSCTLVTMMLNGLTRKYELKLRDGEQQSRSVLDGCSDVGVPVHRLLRPIRISLTRCPDCC